MLRLFPLLGQARDRAFCIFVGFIHEVNSRQTCQYWYFSYCYCHNLIFDNYPIVRKNTNKSAIIGKKIFDFIEIGLDLTLLGGFEVCKWQI